MLVADCLVADVSAVALHVPGLGTVLHGQGEGFANDALFQLRVEHGHASLDGAEEIAAHPVCTGNEQDAVAIVAEVKPARVLKQSAQ